MQMTTREIDSRLKTIAGTGNRGFNIDGLPGDVTELNYPFRVAVGKSGNVYIADAYNYRIRMLDSTTGIVTTVAGDGIADFDGDGGDATAASLDHPLGLAVDAHENIYIADTHNHRIRKVDAITGIITTIAGRELPGFNGDDRLATDADLCSPSSVAVDGEGNVFIADSENHRIRRIDATTGFISTVVGSGVSGFNGDHQKATEAQLHTPMDVAVDTQGNLVIADAWNRRIRKVDAATGLISTVTGTGEIGYNGDKQPATQARISTLHGVAIDSSGNIYFADTYACRVRKVDSATGLISTVAGTGVDGKKGDGWRATGAQISLAFGIAVDVNGYIYISDTSSNRVRRFKPIP